jgi:hypothetical protein
MPRPSLYVYSMVHVHRQSHCYKIIVILIKVTTQQEEGVHFMIIVLVIVSVLLAYVPLVSKYTSTINTFIHEIGHALMAIATFGQVYRIKLNYDTSGHAITGSRWWVGRILTTFAGYPFSVLFPSVMLYLIYHHESNAVLLILIILLSMAILLWIRDILSLLWCASILAIFIMLLKYNVNIESAMIVVMTISFSAAVRSAHTIIMLSFNQSENSGDAYSLSQSTLIPPQIWGLLFFLIAVIVPMYTILLLLRVVPDYYGFAIDFLEWVRQMKIDQWVNSSL